VSLVLPLMGRFLDNSVGAEVIQKMSILPFALIFLYGGLYLRKR